MPMKTFVFQNNFVSSHAHTHTHTHTTYPSTGAVTFVTAFVVAFVVALGMAPGCMGGGMAAPGFMGGWTPAGYAGNWPDLPQQESQGVGVGLQEPPAPGQIHGALQDLRGHVAQGAHLPGILHRYRPLQPGRPGHDRSTLEHPKSLRAHVPSARTSTLLLLRYASPCERDWDNLEDAVQLPVF
ncbi:hypothetical protein CRUP_005398 [Coryphaenoides rupestris]|nr:hypothetical protein CRUP_005398 [Coryphaenoides rupestris]